MTEEVTKVRGGFTRPVEHTVPGKVPGHVRRPATGGFTLVETMTVLLLVSTLARIAVPNVQEMKLGARANEVLGAIRAVEMAATSYHSATLRWPPDGAPGEAPDELLPFLPGDFSFEEEGYALDWEHWALPDGFPERSGKRRILAVSVVSDDPLLLDTLVDRVGEGRPHLALDGRYVFLMEGE